jgi:hypothetical protein
MLKLMLLSGDEDAKPQQSAHEGRVAIEPPIDVVLPHPQDSQCTVSILGVEVATAHEHPKAREQVDSHPAELTAIVAALPTIDPLAGTSRVEPFVENEGLLRDD